MSPFTKPRTFVGTTAMGFVIVLNFMGLFPSWLRAASYQDELSKITFPDKVGVLQRGDPQKYEAEPGQGGVAVPYRGEDAEITVYVRRIPAGATVTADDSIKDALSGIKQMEALGHYSNLKIYLINQDKVRAGWAGAAFTSQSDNRFIVSFIYCRVTPGHLIKVRATTGNPQTEKLTADLDSLLKAIETNAK